MSQRPPISPRSPRAALEPQQVPTPRRSDKVRNPLVMIGNAVITILLVVMLATGGVYVYGKKVLSDAGPLTEDKVVNIPRSAGKADIADILLREGVTRADRWTFLGAVLALGASSNLKSGEYLFQKNATLSDVIGTIVDGKVVQHSFTIPEGLTSEQIVARLQENDIFSGSLKEIPREGTLLPDTYKFPRGTQRDQVIQRMQQAQKRLVTEVWEHRNADLPIKSPEQLVTLASIVEKETGRADERSRVASVFVNRLRQRIKLQSDPTIIYGLVGGKGTLGRPIKRSEIQQPTPYNTYVIEGLPPGPIANPGRASLEATANPARTRDLYFVADGTGGHTFTENYTEHQKAVAKLRSIEQQQQNDVAEPEPTPAPAAAAPAPQTAPAEAAPAPKKPARPKSGGKQSSASTGDNAWRGLTAAPAQAPKQKRASAAPADPEPAAESASPEQ